PRKVPHEDRLLADLPGLAVLERDRDVERPRVGDVLLPALGDRMGRLVELEVAEDDREVAGVVLDRRDVVDRLAEQPLLRIGQMLEGEALDVDQVWYFKRVLEAGKCPPADRGSMRSGQLGDSSDGRGSESARVDSGSRAHRRATPQNTTITHAQASLAGQVPGPRLGAGTISIRGCGGATDAFARTGVTRKASIALACLVAGVSLPGAAQARPGDLDPSFSDDGLVRAHFGKKSWANALAIQD